jgi:hypothetical protein
MQYLLTESEYLKLKGEAIQKIKVNERKLQELCTLAAQHIPIVPHWGEDRTPRPWGCILKRQTPYCDECPVKELCPYDNKEWSK